LRAPPRRFQNRREAGSPHALRPMARVDPLDRDHRHAAPCGNVVYSNRNAFRRVATDRALALPPSRAASVYRKRSTSHAPFSPLDEPPFTSVQVRLSLGQRLAVGLPCGSPNDVTRDASDRLLPSQFFVRAPAPRRLPDGSRVIHARFSEGSPGSRQCDSLRWAPRTPLSGHRPRWALSSQSWSVSSPHL